MATAKIIVTKDGEFMQELDLSRDRTTIGRRPYNDIVLNNAAISGEHAVIATVMHENILEDLNSTNGTYVNGQPVRKHFLQNNDVIELVKYRLQYIDAAHAAQTSSSPSPAQVHATELPYLHVLNGSNAGKVLVLSQEVTTLGRAGAQVASITRNPQGYVIAQVEGPFPQVNDQLVSASGHQLVDGDLIDLSGTRIKFSTQ